MQGEEFFPSSPLRTPVLFLVFNRLDTTKQVFEAIRRAKPPKLYIAADGPRERKEGEVERVKEVREYVMNHIDWNCEVKTLFRDKNLGCGKAVSEAITWFFENEEMGIILEDDTLPSQSFFWFCEAMLEKYKEETRVFMVTGTSYLFDNKAKNDYFFSKYCPIWGWATWRNRWAKYDFSMSKYLLAINSGLLEVTYHWDWYVREQMRNFFEMGYKQKVDTWDFQWSFCVALEGGLCVTPYVNLVSNVGYEGTRIFKKNDPLMNMKRGEIFLDKMEKTNKLVIHNLAVDKLFFYNVFYRYTNKIFLLYRMFSILLRKIIRRIRRGFNAKEI